MMLMKKCVARSCTALLLTTRSFSLVVKEGFHLRNKHRFGYDLNKCIESLPELKKFVRNNKVGEPSVDFTNPLAVKSLNHAMLKSCYDIDHWSIPDDYLCPSIPSRADYIHRISDLVGQFVDTKDIDADIIGLDIGVGSSCIYPIIGVTDYNWRFIGTDVDDTALASAQAIITNNDHLRDNVRLRKQLNPNYIFRGVVRKNDRFDFCIANPPFHSSSAVARRGSERKWRNLNKPSAMLDNGKGKRATPLLNFGGASNELVCEGGEIGFVSRMIKESADPFVHSKVKVFTSLVSSQSNLDVIHRILDKTPQIDQVYTVEMKHGQKKSRIVAWTYAGVKPLEPKEDAGNVSAAGAIESVDAELEAYRKQYEGIYDSDPEYDSSEDNAEYDSDFDSEDERK